MYDLIIDRNLKQKKLLTNYVHDRGEYVPLFVHFIFFYIVPCVCVLMNKRQEQRNKIIAIIINQNAQNILRMFFIIYTCTNKRYNLRKFILLHVFFLRTYLYLFVLCCERIFN